MRLISIILAAGSATRIRPLSYYIPKVLLPVKGKPVLDYLLHNLAGLDIDTHFVVVSEQYETVEKYVKSVPIENLKLVKGLGWETGGDLALALEQIGTNDDAIVMNGDIVTDLDMATVYDVHTKSKAYATIALFKLDNPEDARRFGEVRLGADSFITHFDEKPDQAKNSSTIVNTGFYVFDRRLIAQRKDYLVPAKSKLELNLFPRLAKEGKLFGAVKSLGYWWDVGTIDSYLKAEEYFVAGKGVIPP